MILQSNTKQLKTIQKMINLSPRPMSVNSMPRKNTSKLSDKFNLMNNKSNNQAKNPYKLQLSKSNLLVQELKVFWKTEIQQSTLIQKNRLKRRRSMEGDKVKWLTYLKISMVKSFLISDPKGQACQLKKFNLEKVCLEELKNLKPYLKGSRKLNQTQNQKQQENLAWKDLHFKFLKFLKQEKLNLEDQSLTQCQWKESMVL